MSTDEFLTRKCPACEANTPQAEVSSERRAEDMSLDELRPYWAGFHRDKVFFTYARCGACGLLYAPHFFTLDQLSDLYADLAPNMLEVVTGDAIESTQASYWRAVRELKLPPGGYLEIGPDVGHIVRDAVREGDFSHFWLFEPNSKVHATLAEAAGSRPKTVSGEMDDLSPVPDGSIALAVMIHVLDHLLDPAEILRQIHKKLAPGGAIMIVTHNEKSALRRILGVKFPPFCLQHPELYNPKSIEALLKRTGYSDIRVRRSVNYFPIAFLVRQAAWTIGINLARWPLPSRTVGLKLGNMISIGRR